MKFRYSSPLIQVVIVGIICLLTSGMFNALNGLGGGGQLNTRVASNGNVALYTTFAVGGLLAGPIVNKFGPSVSMALGGTTYALYSASLLYYNHTRGEFFTVFAGAILGLGAALLWTGQGAIMLSYPFEENKGKYIGLFWVIFNLGGVLGSMIPIALNWGSDAGSVNDGTYIGFMVLMGSGALLALALLPPSKVYHDNGQHVVIQKYPKWRTELIEVLKLFFNWKILLLSPMFIASNWFYAYQFNDVNAFYFNIRTRAFNNLWYWSAQIVGAAVFGRILDTASLGRRKRGLIGLLILSIVISAVWAGGLMFQLSYKREDIITPMDLFDHGYAPKLILYILYGANDAMYQCYAYWVMGALTNDAAILARYAGYYKAVQSAGGAISWRIDAINSGFLLQLIVCWALLTVSLPCTFAVVMGLKETNYEQEKSSNKVTDAENGGDVNNSSNNEVVNDVSGTDKKNEE